jgi:hypothetical protein
LVCICNGCLLFQSSNCIDSDLIVGLSQHPKLWLLRYHAADWVLGGDCVDKV